VNDIDNLLNDHLEGEISDILNKQRKVSGTGKKFTRLIVQRIRRLYALASRYERLRDRGMKTTDEMAKSLGVKKVTITNWRNEGILQAHRFDYKNGHLYEPLPLEIVHKAYKESPSKKARTLKSLLIRTEEVQYDA
jgi:hypothetical protein